MKRNIEKILEEYDRISPPGGAFYVSDLYELLEHEKENDRFDLYRFFDSMMKFGFVAGVRYQKRQQKKIRMGV